MGPAVATVVPADAARLDDVLAVVNTPCLWQYWRMSSGDYQRILETDARSERFPRWLMRLELR